MELIIPCLFLYGIMAVMKTLQVNNKTITLIETAHVSKQSVLEVQETIDKIKPDIICIELDENRAQRINQPVDYSSMRLVDVIREKKVILVTINYILSQFQKKVANNMDSKVGDEMRMGITKANEHNIPLTYIDRDVQITFKRIWSYLTLGEKGKFILSFFENDSIDVDESDIEELKKQDVLNNALAQISKEFPTVSRILVTERDQYMAQSIKEAPGENILAIIGAAHGPGIERTLLSGETIDLEALKTIKPPSLLSKILKWTLPLLFMLLILVGFGFNVDGLNKIKDWIIWLSLASGLGAALCLAHPITILVSILTAFIGAIHPILSVGWFAGISEAYFREPKVKDFETLSEDVKSIKKALKNNILRTLIVMLVTSLFSVSVTLFFSIDSIRNFFASLF